MEIRLILMALVCLCIAQVAFAQHETYPFKYTNEQQRFVKLTKEIRCIECQNQTVFDSNATLALDLRTQIYNMLHAGKSDQEIYNNLTNKYGDYILFNPPFKLGTIPLWLGPFAICAMAIWFTMRFWNRSNRK